VPSDIQEKLQLDLINSQDFIGNYQKRNQNPYIISKQWLKWLPFLSYRPSILRDRLEPFPVKLISLNQENERQRIFRCFDTKCVLFNTLLVVFSIGRRMLSLSLP